MTSGAELVLEVSEVCFVNLDLDGSLIVRADNTVGNPSPSLRSTAETDGHSLKGERTLDYSTLVGRIELENVKVQNDGIDWAHHENVYWKHQVYREAFCLIHLQGHSEFKAKNVTIHGHHTFRVPENHLLELIPDASSSNGFKEQLTKLSHSQPSWGWNYQFVDNDIALLHRAN